MHVDDLTDDQRMPVGLKFDHLMQFAFAAIEDRSMDCGMLSSHPP